MFKCLNVKMPERGFTLIEVVAAIFVIITGAVGASIAIWQTMVLTQASIARLTAYYLANEGIEIVRNIRDGNWLENTLWDAGLGPGTWEGDYTMSQNLIAWEGDGHYLKINGGFYQYFSGTPTSFKRKIEILDKKDLDSDGAPDEMTVKVTVEWSKGQITTEEHFYDWKQY